MPPDRRGGPILPDVLLHTDAGLPDVLRCAVFLVDRYGPDTDIHLVLRADAAMEAGNLDGAWVRCRVLVVFDDLRRTTIRSGETRH